MTPPTQDNLQSLIQDHDYPSNRDIPPHSSFPVFRNLRLATTHQAIRHKTHTQTRNKFVTLRYPMPRPSANPNNPAAARPGQKGASVRGSSPKPQLTRAWANERGRCLAGLVRRLLRFAEGWDDDRVTGVGGPMWADIWLLSCDFSGEGKFPGC
ncbi:hypothetical protein N658DRAFT_184992 [Parathielavia hyrcaniae]|uniref:Uncharacterized protein n=1 Tax=Parathielavia hyrcaniae TaxID=113614 RepID=A0AAN6T5B5_9PEZI|nr:hypothetical protein N658DRAFT_184992 [Parathielavia hyrcaniae]